MTEYEIKRASLGRKVADDMEFYAKNLDRASYWKLRAAMDRYTRFTGERYKTNGFQKA